MKKFLKKKILIIIFLLNNLEWSSFNYQSQYSLAAETLPIVSPLTEYADTNLTLTSIEIGSSQKRPLETDLSLEETRPTNKEKAKKFKSNGMGLFL